MSDPILLFIDLDGFFSARLSNKPDLDPAEELTLLGRGIRRLIADAEVPVRRAYVDLAGEPRRFDANLLAKQGITGVHVRSGKGAPTLLRMGLDAQQIAATAPERAQFYLVVGAEDPTPILVLLREQMRRIVVIGVAGHTSPELRPYCDELLAFEDLAARTADVGEEYALVRGAVLEILGRRRPVPLAQLGDLLNRSLGRPFDPAAFGSAGLEDFLRSHSAEIGVTLRPGERDVTVVDLRHDGTVIPAAGGPAPRHEAGEYRQLLRLRNPRIHLTSRDEWLQISEAFYQLAGGEGTARQVVFQQELSDEVMRHVERNGLEAPEKKVQAIVFQLFKCGAFVCAEPGSEGDSDFHWSRPARLSDAVTDVESMRRLARVYIARILLERLQSQYGSVEVDSEAFTEMLEGPGAGEDRIDAMEEVLDQAEDDLVAAGALRAETDPQPAT